MNWNSILNGAKSTLIGLCIIASAITVNAGLFPLPAPVIWGANIILAVGAMFHVYKSSYDGEKNSVTVAPDATANVGK